MTFPILGVHGINTPAIRVYADEWRDALGDPSVEVREARWESTGNVAGDVYRILLDHRQRNRAVDAITSELRDFVVTGGKLLLAHSMGEPILLEAERRVRSGLPIITIGGPLSHPVFGSLLASVGLRRPTPGDPPLRFWNEHDGVSCSRVLGARQPPWMECHRVAVAGDHGWVVEHDAALYLQNENVRRAVQEIKELAA